MLFTWDQWKDNEAYQKDWEAFTRTDCGAALLQMLTSRMMGELGYLIPREANLIEWEAISGASTKGYKACYKNLTEATYSKIKEMKTISPQASEAPPNVQSLLMPSQAVIDRVNAEYDKITGKTQ